jgi:hypothetical protein
LGNVPVLHPLLFRNLHDLRLQAFCLQRTQTLLVLLHIPKDTLQNHDDVLEALLALDIFELFVFFGQPAEIDESGLAGAGAGCVVDETEGSADEAEALDLLERLEDVLDPRDVLFEDFFLDVVAFGDEEAEVLFDFFDVGDVGEIVLAEHDLSIFHILKFAPIEFDKIFIH